MSYIAIEHWERLGNAGRNCIDEPVNELLESTSHNMQDVPLLELPHCKSSELESLRKSLLQIRGHVSEIKRATVYEIA